MEKPSIESDHLGVIINMHVQISNARQSTLDWIAFYEDTSMFFLRTINRFSEKANKRLSMNKLLIRFKFSFSVCTFFSDIAPV